MKDTVVSNDRCVAFVSEHGNLAKTPKPANQKPLLSYLAIVVGIPIAVALVALVCIIGYMTYLRKRAITNRKGNLCATCTTI